MMSEEEVPVVSIGDQVKVDWCLKHETDGTTRKGEVIDVAFSKKYKHGTHYKYSIQFSDGEIVETRLIHLNWKLREKRKRRKQLHNDEAVLECINGAKATECVKMGLMPPHQYILAPMVGASELAFRMLCRQYGSDLAYTPMINSDKFVADATYREQEFQTVPADRPLVAHFSANKPETLLRAALLVQDRCDAIDLNLGCPQRVAYAGHYGSFLLDDQDRDLVCDIVRTVSGGIRIPMFVKIRLLSTVEETIVLCKQLIDAGASLIAIHGRHRVNLVNRTGPGARDGPALLDQIAAVKQALLTSKDDKYASIPIVSNGNIITYKDVVDNKTLTKCDGVMSAEGILDNPALFYPRLMSADSGDNTNTALSVIPSPAALAIQYLDYCEKFPVLVFKSVVFHVRRMLKKELVEYQLLEDCLNSVDVVQVRSIVEKIQVYQEKGKNFFQADLKKQKKQLEILERRKKEESKRKDYEGRMMRKAKREGRTDLMFYLHQQLKEIPNMSEIEELKKIPKEECFSIWKNKHSQHCYAFHFEADGCKRDRTCGFLHCDAVTMMAADVELYG